MIDTKETTIGEHSYQVTTLGSEKGLEVFARLFQLVGPAVAAAMTGATSLADIEVDAAAAAIRELAAKAIPQELSWFVKAFLPSIQVQREGAPGFVPLNKIYELHFSGAIHELLQLIWFCCEVNYSGFLSVYANAAKAAKAKKDAAAPAIVSSSPSPLS